MATLLEKAKSSATTKTGKTYSEEEMELALAWMRGEIGITQVCKALGKINLQGSDTYLFLARALRQYAIGKK